MTLGSRSVTSTSCIGACIAQRDVIRLSPRCDSRTTCAQSPCAPAERLLRSVSVNMSPVASRERSDRLVRSARSPQTRCHVVIRRTRARDAIDALGMRARRTRCAGERRMRSRQYSANSSSASASTTASRSSSMRRRARSRRRRARTARCRAVVADDRAMRCEPLPERLRRLGIAVRIVQTASMAARQSRRAAARRPIVAVGDADAVGGRARSGSAAVHQRSLPPPHFVQPHGVIEPLRHELAAVARTGSPCRTAARAPCPAPGSRPRPPSPRCATRGSPSRRTDRRLPRSARRR